MSTGCCEELIDVGRLAVRQRRVLLWVMCINLATFLMMVAGSVLSGSSALLSGTLDNFGDALAYMVSLAVVGASVQVKAKAALFKSVLIGFAAVAGLVQIIVKGLNPDVPIVETMGIAAVLNLMANSLCLMLLTPHRSDDVNMASVWECSRNDVFSRPRRWAATCSRSPRRTAICRTRSFRDERFATCLLCREPHSPCREPD